MPTDDNACLDMRCGNLRGSAGILPVWFAIGAFLLCAAACGADPFQQGWEIEDGNMPPDEVVRLARQKADKGDFSGYYPVLLLASDRHGRWDSSQRLEWYELAGQYLQQRSRTAASWKTIDYPRFVQLLCEKETLHWQLGAYGSAFQAFQQADKLVRENWGADVDAWPVAHLDDFVLIPHINYLEDKAKHEECAGRLGDAWRTHKQCLALIRKNMASSPAFQDLMSRSLNNFSVSLSIGGQDRLSETYRNQAINFENDGDASLIAEISQVRNESMEEQPTEEHCTRLRKVAARLRTSNRLADALLAERRIASILSEMGRIADAEKQFNEVIADASANKFSYVTAETFLWRGKSRMDRDPSGAAVDIEKALDHYRSCGMKPYEFRAYVAYARLNAQQGHFEDALDILQEALEMTAFMGAAHLRPELLGMKACWLNALGRSTDADKAWSECFREMEGLPDISDVRRLRTMAMRWKYLEICGRREDAEAYGAILRGLLAKSDLSAYCRDSILKGGDTENRQVKDNRTAQPAAGSAELQPFYCSVRTTTSSVFQAWLWLLNNGSRTARGRLTLTAPGNLAFAAQSNPQELRASIDRWTTGTPSVVQQAVEVPAYVSLPIHIQSVAHKTDEVLRIDASWVSEDATQTNEARVDIAGGAESLTCLASFHQNLSAMNAFSSIPLYHELSMTSGTESPLNLRVRATSPCRLEVYSLDDECMLGVDADGNGSFLDVGDVLNRDDNNDGYPDVRKDRTSILVEMFPVGNQPLTGAVDVVLEAFIGGTWRPAGTDRILPPQVGPYAPSRPPPPAIPTTARPDP